MLDRANLEVAQSQLASWVASVRTLVRPTTESMVNPSPHPMQQLASHICNTNLWKHNLFESIRDEGIDLENPVVNNVHFVNAENAENPGGVDVGPGLPSVVIFEEDVKYEIEFWNSAIVCYVLGITPPVRILNGFIRRVWGNLEFIELLRDPMGYL